MSDPVRQGDERLRDEIQKRLTLNWLIQGASQHTGLTLHHLVHDQLVAVDEALPKLYDQYALMGLLQYWRPIPALLFGWPPSNWRRAATKKSHPFFGHRLLSRHGGELAEAGRQRALERGRIKGVKRLPFTFTPQLLLIATQITRRERKNVATLEHIARRAASMVWGVPMKLLEGRLDFSTPLPPIAPIRKPKNIRESIFLAGVVGWGGVVRNPQGELRVAATAKNGCLLAKELVKGTGELICLHGLSGLDDKTYEAVMFHTDRFDFEPPMIQTGGELWRRFLRAMPIDRAVAEVFMSLARLPPADLESVVELIITEPERAKKAIAHLKDVEE